MPFLTDTISKTTSIIPNYIHLGPMPQRRPKVLEPSDDGIIPWIWTWIKLPYLADFYHSYSILYIEFTRIYWLGTFYSSYKTICKSKIYMHYLYIICIIYNVYYISYMLLKELENITIFSIHREFSKYCYKFLF